MASFSIRVLTRDDAFLLPLYLQLAAHEPSVGTTMKNLALARYVEDWGRRGDFGLVALDAESGEDIGMVWARLWAKNAAGFGFIDEATPELAIAVRSEWRGQGVGSTLIEALLSQINNDRTMPFERVSLNVRADSPALKLYERLGFERVASSDVINRVGSVSFNMVANLFEASD